MVDTVYRLIPQKDRRISVEMVKPNGRRRVIPDFVDEAEANAWIIQTQRLNSGGSPISAWAEAEKRNRWYIGSAQAVRVVQINLVASQWLPSVGRA